VTYEAFDQSVQDGDPVHLFLFVYEGTEYRFTDIANDYTALGETWVSSGLRSGQISQSNDFIKDTVSIAFPRDDTFAELFLSDVQDSQTSVTIHRGYAGDPDQEFIAWWKGRVATSKAGGSTITIDCEPIFTSLRRPGLRRRYQRSCPYALYGRGCNADPESFAVEDDITAEDGLTFTIPAAALQTDGFYTGGMLRAPDTVLRFIVNHVGDLITISKPHVGLVVSATIKIYPGCDRSTVTCLNTFDNLDNFGGFPFIPTKNPFGGSSIV
jgi:uncharacterized phage protein (TIGR02218 family)